LTKATGVNAKNEKGPKRDTAESQFSKILSKLALTCSGFLAAVFFDNEGETIDYYSYLDPFKTRLTAAHIGIVVKSAMHRFKWMNLGEVACMEIYAKNKESITISIGEELFLTIILESGNINPKIYRYLWEISNSLREEIGF
jgi:predicted regulator of Ras-like GTPase activity (Roadblock/LC7/MglB family)